MYLELFSHLLDLNQKWNVCSVLYTFIVDVAPIGLLGVRDECGHKPPPLHDVITYWSKESS